MQKNERSFPSQASRDRGQPEQLFRGKFIGELHLKSVLKLITYRSLCGTRLVVLAYCYHVLGMSFSSGVPSLLAAISTLTAVYGACLHHHFVYRHIHIILWFIRTLFPHVFPLVREPPVLNSMFVYPFVPLCTPVYPV